MKTKIRVHGKSQSRTALGIINAYLALHPDSTLSDLQSAFPKFLNPKSFADNIIVPVKEAQGYEKMFFEKEDELVVLKNGQKLALVEVWVKEDFDAICEHAKQYGIEVAEIEEAKAFQKGSYELEYMDEPVRVAAAPIRKEVISEQTTCKTEKKKCRWWLWLLLLLLLLLLLFFCMKKCGYCCHGDKCPSTDTIVAPVVNVDVDSVSLLDKVKGKLDALTNNFIYDTGDTIAIKLPDGKEWRIGQNSSEYKLYSFLSSDEKVDTLDKATGWITLDRLYFETGKANLTPDSKKQLENIGMILKLFPNCKIKMGGYTDNTGTEEINMKLSTERAKTTADQLIALGIDAKRVAYEGYGQQHPICPSNDTDPCRALNRRIDVKVTQK